MAALVGNHEEVLEVEPRLPEEGRERVKEEGKADRLPRVFRDQGLRVPVRAEEVFSEQLLRHRDLVLELLETRQLANQMRDDRNVGLLTVTDDHRHLGRSRKRNTNRIAP